MGRPWQYEKDHGKDGRIKDSGKESLEEFEVDCQRVYDIENRTMEGLINKNWMSQHIYLTFLMYIMYTDYQYKLESIINEDYKH